MTLPTSTAGAEPASRPDQSGNLTSDAALLTGAPSPAATPAGRAPSTTPLTGRVALVTGGSRGIGAAVTEKLVAWGARVAVGYVDRPRPAAELAVRLGDAVTTHQADVSDPGEVRDLVTGAVDAHGRLDILVHCAAAATYGDVTATTPTRWAFTQAASLESLVHLAAAARPHLGAAEHARLVTVSNTLPHRIVPGGGALAAAKAGVEALTRYLAYGLAADGIVVNGVRPGLVPTGILDVRPAYRDTLAREQAASPWPGSRTTQASDVADVVAALCLP